MQIAVASLGDPFSVKTWSGTPVHVIDALKKRGHNIVGITLNKPAEPWYYNWLRRGYYWLQKKWFMAGVEAPILKAIGKQLDEEVNKINPAVVIIMHGDFLAYTTFKQPAVIIHDTTFASLLGYYKVYSSLTERSIKAGNDMYSRALKRADAAVFSADWATQSALKDYNADPQKVHTIPFGANLNTPPAPNLVQQWIHERTQSEVCRFLFLGVNWVRKGGPDVLRFIAHLNKNGVKCVLNVVGVEPEIAEELKPYVNVVGFLRKSVPEEAKQLEKLLQTSNALITPSIAECYGCVFCEANAYGLPALARNTGGIPEIIKEGTNGLMLGENESPEAFADRWAAIWLNRKAYEQMATLSRLEFETRLNYDVFAEKLEKIMVDVM